MRKILITILALGAIVFSAATFTSCKPVIGSGNTVNQDYSFTNFTRVSAGWSFSIQVVESTNYSVSVSVDDNLKSYLEVSQDGDTVNISMKNGYTYIHAHLTAMVNMPRLTSVTLSGACTGHISGFSSADDLTLNVSGASHATCADLLVNKITMDVSGASHVAGSLNASGNASLQASGASSIDIGGKAVDADIEVSGASGANLINFTLRDVHVNISGASNATVAATGSLSGDISGASHLNYTGSPTLGNLKTSGASSVSKK